MSELILKHMLGGHSGHCVHDNLYLEPEDISFSECERCRARAEAKRLSSEGKLKDAALHRAIEAISSLPEDALGFGESSESHRWPLRDELHAQLVSAVSGRRL